MSENLEMDLEILSKKVDELMEQGISFFVLSDRSISVTAANNSSFVSSKSCAPTFTANWKSYKSKHYC